MGAVAQLTAVQLRYKALNVHVPKPTLGP